MDTKRTVLSLEYSKMYKLLRNIYQQGDASVKTKILIICVITLAVLAVTLMLPSAYAGRSTTSNIKVIHIKPIKGKGEIECINGEPVFILYLSNGKILYRAKLPKEIPVANNKSMKLRIECINDKPIITVIKITENGKEQTIKTYKP